MAWGLLKKLLELFSWPDVLLHCAHCEAAGNSSDDGDWRQHCFCYVGFQLIVTENFCECHSIAAWKIFS